MPTTVVEKPAFLIDFENKNKELRNTNERIEKIIEESIALDRKREVAEKEKNEYSQFLISCFENQIKEKLSREYLKTFLSSYKTYKDAGRSEIHKDTFRPRNIIQLLHECIIKLIDKQEVIIGLPFKTETEKKQVEKLKEVFHDFKYKTEKEEHQALLVVGSLQVFTNVNEREEPFIYLKVTSPDFVPMDWGDSEDD